MKLNNIRVYQGRNIYSHYPVIRVDVDVEEFVDIPTCDIEGFNEGLLKLLPGLKEHKCCTDRPGGFCERLQRGTYLAHVLEHIAIELQGLLGYKVSYGKARYLESETVYYVVYTYINETAGMEAGSLAYDIIQSLINKNSIDLQDRLRGIEEKVRLYGLGPSTQAIVDEAEKRKIPVMRLGENSLVQLGYGCYGRKIQATLTDATSCIAADIASDKQQTKDILSSLGIPVPEGQVVIDCREAIAVAEVLGYPVVVKPYNGNQGKGVSIELRNDHEVAAAFELARCFSERVMVERFIEGKNYRITVVGGRLVAAALRIAAHVVGDGNSSIKELIEIENSNPQRGIGHERPLTQMTVDDVMLLNLSKINKRLEDVPALGEVIFLRENANLSTGGIAIDVTEEIHPDNARLAISAVRAVGLDVAGVDLTIEDISRSIYEIGGAIIEVNACPGIRMHHYPSKGKSRNVAKAIVDQLFPQEGNYQLPIFSITGTNGKTTTTRMIAKILRKNGRVVGMTSTGGVFLQDEEIMKGDTTGPKSARAILMDRRTEVAVLETARGGIVNRGLGYDLADVAVITNIGDDHLGLDGINTLEEMADVKALVVEAVKKGGYAVINADDAFAERIAARVKCNIVYFSKHHENPIVIKHRAEGGKALYLKSKTIYAFDGAKELPIINIKNIPATLGGYLRHNVENSLAAASAAFSYGIDISIIREALSEFQTDVSTNPGRFNIFELKGFKVIVDYGHNIDGYNTVLDGLKALKQGRLIGIIGVPGDRPDINILKIGEISGKYFDYVYIKEDKDLRGRMPEEVAKLLKKGCSFGGLSEEKMEILLCEVECLKKAMNHAIEGDIIIVFYEAYKPLIDAIETYRLGQQANIIKDLPLQIAMVAGKEL